MKIYLITYDLIKPETSADYAKLFANIKSHLSWAKPMKSVWFVKTNRPRAEVMSLLKSSIDLNDKILIIQVTSSWISRNLPDTVITWMRNNI